PVEHVEWHIWRPDDIFVDQVGLDLLPPAIISRLHPPKLVRVLIDHVALLAWVLFDVEQLPLLGALGAVDQAETTGAHGAQIILRLSRLALGPAPHVRE